MVHDGIEYPLDVLIYATGFQWMATASFNMITGRDGRSLRQKWQDEGVRTFLGIHSHGFPNLMIMSGPQGGGGPFNFIMGLESHTAYVVWMLSEMRSRWARFVAILKAPEDAYAQSLPSGELPGHRLAPFPYYHNGG